MPSEITIQKLDSSGVTTGALVTIYAREIDDAFANKLFVITPATSKNNQSDGPEDSIIVDLLRITRTILISGEITGTSSKTASEVKKDLIDILGGGGTNGGRVRMTYDALGTDYITGSTTQVEGVIEKLAFNETPKDEPSSVGEDFAKFIVQITFVSGVLV